ncbi:hypothetical protein RKD18_007674 [Streptomyces phaeoluteigriseus]
MSASAALMVAAEGGVIGDGRTGGQSGPGGGAARPGDRLAGPGPRRRPDQHRHSAYGRSVGHRGGHRRHGPRGASPGHVQRRPRHRQRARRRCRGRPAGSGRRVPRPPGTDPPAPATAGGSDDRLTAAGSRACIRPPRAQPGRWRRGRPTPQPGTHRGQRHHERRGRTPRWSDHGGMRCGPSSRGVSYPGAMHQTGPGHRQPSRVPRTGGWAARTTGGRPATVSCRDVFRTCRNQVRGPVSTREGCGRGLLDRPGRRLQSRDAAPQQHRLSPPTGPPVPRCRRP